MRGLSLWLGIALVLAGCSSAPRPPADADGEAFPETDFAELDLRATKETGIVHGLVVDAAIVPIVEAAVTLQPGNLSTTSDAKGRFGFADLAPGAYVVRATHADYTETQTTLQVVAGDSEPRPAMLVLQRLAGTEPYVTAMAWQGYMQCSLIAAGFFFTGCMAADVTDDESRRQDAVDVQPDFLQSELTWDSTQALGNNLCMKHYAIDEEGFEPIVDTQGRAAEACGAVPVVQSFDRASLNATAVGQGRGIERVVWVAYAIDGALGMAFEQQFTVYSHLFHNFVPPMDWTFVRDGSPAVPPA
jgi:hypothetical protein